jgi:predicted RecA/RadA family phage recombinase
MKTAKVPAHESNVVEFINGGSDIPSGQGVVIATGVGMASDLIKAGKTGTVMLTGQHKVPKQTGQAWTAGGKIYFNNSSKEFNTTAGGNTLAGWAYRAAASGDTTGYVYLLPPPGT